MPVQVKILCDSFSKWGHRLTTMEIVIHRFVLAEFNTHRAFSRNSASSRAIPIKKQISRVMIDPAIPLEWGKIQKGMQASEILDAISAAECERIWLQSRDRAVETVQALSDLGLHKQVANRILEPYMWHTIIVSSTEWQNFWTQRCSPLAQPEIRVAAEAMRDAYMQSMPNFLSEGQWHLPYIRDDEWHYDVETLKQISVARCARVSYLTQSGVRDINEDLDLFNRLTNARPPHFSPLEHVATPYPDGSLSFDGVQISKLYMGNFRGWVQLRHALSIHDISS